MKTRMRFLFISLIAACPLIFSSCNNNPNSENHTNDSQIPDDQLAFSTINVSGLVCTDCSNSLKGKLESSEGIISAEVDFKAQPQKCQVKHNKKISTEDIKKMIVAAGVTVED